MDGSGADPGPEPRPETWREAVRAEMRRRRRHPAGQRSAVRRLTISVAVVAAGLNGVLFIQTGIEQSGPGAVQDAIVSAVAGLFPRGGLQPAQPPVSSPGATPVATTGGS